MELWNYLNEFTQLETKSFWVAQCLTGQVQTQPYSWNWSLQQSKRMKPWRWNVLCWYKCTSFSVPGSAGPPFSTASIFFVWKPPKSRCFLFLYLSICLSNGDFVKFCQTQDKIAGQKQEREKHKGVTPICTYQCENRTVSKSNVFSGSILSSASLSFFLLQNPIKCLLKSRNLRKKSWKCLHLWWNTGLVFWAESHQTTAVLDGKKRKRSWYTRNPSQMHHLDLQAF